MKQIVLKQKKWVSEILNKWAAGIAHVFLLHGNVDDYVAPGISVKDYILKTKLMADRECVIIYNRSSGINFPLVSHRDKFMSLVGLDNQQQNDVLRALQQAQGGGEDEIPLPAAPSQAFPMIERALKARGENNHPVCALIVEYAETVLPNADLTTMPPDDRSLLVTLLRWAREPEFTTAGPPIFLLTQSLTDMHQNLRNAASRIESVEIPLPDYEERKEFLAVQDNIDEDQAAALTAGLKLVHIEDIVLRASLEDRPVDAELIKSRKNEIARAEFAEVLELKDPDKGFECIGGMEHVKSFFRRNVIEPIRRGNLRRVPLGILLPGPPGTGKTLLAECVAKESGLNCAALNLSKIFNQWVGSSERALEKALSCLEALAPCLVIVDEIDQSGLSRENSGDSGVSNRLFKRLLEFMSDTGHRGKIVFVGLTNRPDLMDAALKRPGRFDRKLPVLPPDEEERAQIFDVMFQKYSIKYSADLKVAARETDGYTGAEIEALVLKSLEVAEDSGSETVDSEHLNKALYAYVPTTRDIQAQIRYALAECNDRDLLPPAYQRLLGDKKEVAAKPRETRTLRDL